MKKIIILALAVLIGASAASAQSYKHAVGLKIGYDISLTYKQNLSEANSFDVGLDLSFFGGYFGVSAYGFYNWQWNIDAVPGLNWYVGPGAHVGLYAGGFGASVHGQIGLEYKFNNIPLALSLDYAPGLGFYATQGAFAIGYAGTYGGLGVKYTF